MSAHETNKTFFFYQEIDKEVITVSESLSWITIRTEKKSTIFKKRFFLSLTKEDAINLIDALRKAINDPT